MNLKYKRNMETLTEIFKEIGHFGSDIGCNDKNSTHTYTDVYDKLFEPFRNGCTMMEVGLAMGDSIDLWDRYFENSRIVGIDLSIVFKMKKYRNMVQLIEADATMEVPRMINGLRFDIIIDDGSHQEAHQFATFRLFKNRMNPGGIYVVEDILSLDSNRKVFESLHENCEVFDMRSNGRFDNVLIVYRF
jgi:demethylmacrocin O-methyltransferase